MKITRLVICAAALLASTVFGQVHPLLLNNSNGQVNVATNADATQNVRFAAGQLWVGGVQVVGGGGEVPLTFSTGLTRASNVVTVNTTQNITRLSGLTTNGFVKTSSSNGTLTIDTTTYLSSVSVTANNGISQSVTGGAITLGLGNLTPTSVAATGTVTGSNLSGTNTGDATIAAANNGVTASFSGQALTLGLGAITPSSVAATGTITAAGLIGTTGASSGFAFAERDATGTDWILYATTGSARFYNGSDRLTLGATGNLNASGAVTGSNLSGTNTGDQTITLTGDATGTGTGSFAVTLASVGTPGTYGDATHTLSITTDAKGRVTAVSANAITAAGIGAEPTIVGGTTAQYWRGDKSWQTLNGSAVGLGSVTNDAQTKAAIVPNTAPSSGQILVGNAGNTAYAPKTISGSGATITVDNAGVFTIGGIANASLTNSTISIAGNSTALGGTISRDTITGVSIGGVIARTALNTLTARTITGTTNQISVSAGDGVSGNPTLSIPSSAQLSVAKLTNLTSNGPVKTSGSDGTLSVSAIDLSGSEATGTLAAGRMPALTGDVTNTAGTLATTVGKINGVSLAGLATGILKNTTTTGVPSIAVAGDFPTLNQSTTGNAATATALQTARTIGGVTFDGTGNITVATATGGFTVSGGNLALSTNSLTMTGSIGATGARVTKGWFTDLEMTNLPSVNGTALTTTIAKLNLLTSAAGTTGTTSTNIMFSASPTTTGTLTADDVNLSATSKVYKINGTKMVAADTVNNNYFIGPSGNASVTGSLDIAIGYAAMGNTTTAGYSVAIGYNALGGATNTGSDNLALGVHAIASNTTGGNNTAFGSAALTSNNTGNNNIGFGREAAQANTKGNGITAMGYRSLYNFNITSSTETYTTSIGASTGLDLTTGLNNTLLGANTGRGITTGGKNTIVGANVTGLSSSLANTVILADGDGNQRLVLDSSSARLPALTTNGLLKTTSGNGTLSVTALPTSDANGQMIAADYNVGVQHASSFAPNVVFEGDSITQQFVEAQYTDIVMTSGSAAITSATAKFVASDVGVSIQDGNVHVPGTSTTIASVTDSTHATMSANALGSSGTYTARIYRYGYNNLMGAPAGPASDTQGHSQNFTAAALGTVNTISVTPYYGQNVAVAGKQSWELFETSYRVNNLYRQEALNVLVYDAGTNDIGGGTFGTAYTAQQAYEKIAATLRHYRAMGWKIVLVGLISRGDSNTGSADDTKVGTVNALLRQNWEQIADRFVDWAIVDNGTNPFIGATGGGVGGGTWYNSDRLHPSYAGSRKLASYVAPYINDLLTYYFQPQLGQAFVRTETATHTNDIHTGTFTLQNDNPNAGVGQSQINFSFNTSGTYSLKENIRGDAGGVLNFGATVGHVFYAGSTGPDVYGTTGLNGPPAIFALNNTQTISYMPMRVQTNSVTAGWTGAGLEFNYNTSLDYGVITSYNYTTPAWKPLLIQASFTKFATSGTDRMTLNAGLNIGGTPDPGAGSLTLSATNPTLNFYTTQNSYNSVGMQLISGATSGAWNASYLDVYGHNANTSTLTLNFRFMGSGEIMLRPDISQGGIIYFGNGSGGARYLQYNTGVGGGVYDFGNAGVYANGSALTSSRNAKHGIKSWSRDFDVLALNPSLFTYNGPDGTPQRLGFIADEVKPIVPEAILPAPNGPDGEKREAIDPMAMIAALTRTVQQQERRIRELEKKQHEKIPDNNIGSLPIRYSSQLLAIPDANGYSYDHTDTVLGR